MDPLTASRSSGAWRLATASALVGLGATALGAWVATASSRAALERTARARVANRLARVDRDLERARSEVAEALEAVVRRLSASIARGPDGLEGAAEATSLAERGALDFLTLLEASGRVRSSAEWPQLAGLRAPWLDDVAEGAPQLRRVRGPQGSVLALLARRRVGPGPEALTVVGGRRLSAGVASNEADPAWLVELDPDGARDRGPATLEGREPDAAWRAWAFAGADVDPPRGPSGPAWVGGHRTLADADGEAVAVVAVASPIGDAWLPGGVRAWVAMAVIAGGCAGCVGAWRARGLARPIDRLLRAVDAVAAGRADYAFGAAGGDDFDRIAAAFSRLERSLARQRARAAAVERTAAWSEVARHVAHEVKNPLVPIRLTIENLVRVRDRDAALFDKMFAEGARTILEEVDQLARLVGEFAEFARLPAPRRRPVKPHALLDGVLDLHAAEPGLTVERSYAAGAVRLDADPDQLGRALKNLVGNAVEAMRESAGVRRLDVRTDVTDGMFEIEIADNGPGIPSSTAERMFEPYVTTKPQGTGLGLVLARRIVVEHGGFLEVENLPAGGAFVRVRLPVTDCAQSREESPA